MQYIVATAAVLGCITGLMVGLYAISRLVMVVARDWMLPPFLARVSTRTQTPLVAQIVLGLIIGEDDGILGGGIGSAQERREWGGGPCLGGGVAICWTGILGWATGRVGAAGHVMGAGRRVVCRLLPFPCH